MMYMRGSEFYLTFEFLCRHGPGPTADQTVTGITVLHLRRCLLRWYRVNTVDIFLHRLLFSHPRRKLYPQCRVNPDRSTREPVEFISTVMRVCTAATTVVSATIHPQHRKSIIRTTKIRGKYFCCCLLKHRTLAMCMIPVVITGRCYRHFDNFFVLSISFKKINKLLCFKLWLWFRYLFLTSVSPSLLY